MSEQDGLSALPALTLIDGGRQDSRPGRRRQRIGTFLVPPGFELWADGLYAIGEGQSPEPGEPSILSTPPPKHRRWLDRIAQRPLWISRRGRCLDTKEHLVEVSALDELGAVTTTWASRLDLADKSALARLAKDGMPIRTGNAARIEAYLDQGLHENAPDLPEILVAARSGAYETASLRSAQALTGWLVGHQWIGPGSQPVTSDPRSTTTWAEGFRARGELPAWCAMLEVLNGKGPIARWLNGTTFAAPLLRFIGHRTFIVHHWAPARSGKTALARFAMTAWGDPQLLVLHHNRTEISMMEIFKYVTDLPVVLDELQASPKARDHSQLLYSLCLERGRARSQRAGGLHDEIKSWRTIVRMTGEESIVGQGRLNLGGQGARTVEIDSPVLEGDEARELNVWCSRGPHGLAGPVFLEWLWQVVNGQGGIESLTSAHRNISEQLVIADIPDDQAGHLAVGALGQALASHVLLGEDLKSALEQAKNDAIQVASGIQTADSAYVTVTDRALQLIRDHRHTHRMLWFDLSNPEDSAMIASLRYQRMFGIVTPTEVWLLQLEARKLFASAGLPDSRVWADLKRDGWVVDNGRATGYADRRQHGSFESSVFVLRRPAVP